MLTSIVILTYNRLDYTKQCIESIRKFTKKNSYEIIIVDNNSVDGTIEWLKQQHDITTILNNENLGFPAGCNQGMKTAKGDNILLLNNDTIVTPGWLDNMIACLYSSESIGAVGPVTNNSPYYQTIPVPYKDTSGVEGFAKGYNRSDSSKWEERIKLIGFCMLIKKEVMDRIGFFDEIFTPGNYEDDDYCIRMRRAGYKVVLCKDTFIHHFGSVSFRETGSFGKLLKENELKFKQKWGFASRENMDINFEIADKISSKEDGRFNVLELGCGCGATLLYIKNKHPGARLFGVDKNIYALEEASRIADTVEADMENLGLGFPEKHFDYVIMGDVLQQIEHKEALFKKIKKHIKDDGEIFIGIPNIMNLFELYGLLGKNAARGGIDVQNIKNYIDAKSSCLDEICNYLSVSGYRNVAVEKIPIQSVESGEEVVKLLGGIMDNEHAGKCTVKQYILSANAGCDDEISIPGQNSDRRLKFLLRRIENDVDAEESKNQLMDIIADQKIDDKCIIDIVLKDIIEKDSVLNIIGVECFERGLYDYVIPFLRASYELNNQNKDTIFNLGYVLHASGENKMALEYLQKIEGADEEVDKLIAGIKGIS